MSAIVYEAIVMNYDPRKISPAALIHYKESHGDYALIKALQANPYLAYMLILEGFPVNFVGTGRYSPLHLAISNMHMKLFVNNGVRDTIPENQVYYDIVVELVKNGANPDFRETHFGSTPFRHLNEGPFREEMFRILHEQKNWERRKNAMFFFANITGNTGNAQNPNFRILKTPVFNVQELASNIAFNAQHNAFISINNLRILKHKKKEINRLLIFSQKNIQHNIVTFL